MSSEQAGDFRGTDRFRIRRRLGAGGMGVVYLAHDGERNAEVALKTLPRLDAGGIYRLKQEFRSLADVTHPNLAALHELISAGDEWFFTMELVEGVDFRRWVRDEGESVGFDRRDAGAPESTPDAALTALELGATLELAQPSATPPEEAREPGVPFRKTAPKVADDAALAMARVGSEVRLRAALKQLVHGVMALHAAGKLHLDLKPPNVLVTRDGRVVLLDFGLVTDQTAVGERVADEGLYGTPTYMAPEQIEGRGATPASDWYAVGVMLYEALTGRLPFRGTVSEVMLGKLDRDALAPAEIVPDVASDLNALCVDLMGRVPEERPTGADILARLGGSARSVRRVAPALRAASAEFLGRDPQLLALERAFEAAASGRPVRVHVHARSGMGKTALVQRFLDGLRSRGAATVLAGRCYERESVPFKAFDSIIDGLTNLLRRLSRAEATALLSGGAHDLARVFPVLQRVDALADVPAPPANVPDRHELRRRAFAALRALLRGVASRRPLVLAIDDLQWGDLDSARLLLDLLAPPGAPPMLVLCSYRSEAAADSPMLAELARATAPGQISEIELGPLSTAEAGTLALALLGRTDAEAQRKAAVIAAESEGSPFFVGELARHAEAGGAHVSLGDVVRARVSRLSEASRRLLELVAVAGRPIDQSIVEGAARVPDAPTALQALRGGALVRTEGNQIEIYHDRIRETVLAMQGAAELRAHHRELAAALEAARRVDAEVLAGHFRDAGDLGRARAYARTAADEAARALAFDRAARLYRMVLELDATAPALAGATEERRALLALLGDALVNAGRGAEAARAFLDAAEGAGADAGVELRRRAAEQLLISGHIDEGLRVLDEVLASVGMRLAPTPGRALVSFVARSVWLRIRGIGFRERADAEVPRRELERIDICFSAALGLTFADPIRGADFQARHLLVALGAGEPYRIALGLANYAAHVATEGGPAKKRTSVLLAKTHALAERLGHPHALGRAAMASGTAAFLEGRWKDALGTLDGAERIFRERCTGVAWELDGTQQWARLCLWNLGDLEELARRTALHLRDAGDRGDLFTETWIRASATASAALAKDDVDLARSEVLEATRKWTRQDFQTLHFLALWHEVLTDLYAGDGQGALRRITERWPAVEKALLLRIQALKLTLLQLRAFAAVAAARDGGGPAPLRAAEKDARAIERERMPWSDPFVPLIRAGIAAVRGDAEAARTELARAPELFDAADMKLWAAASRRHLGVLLGGDEGASLVAAADGSMRGQGIVAPERWVAMLAPGCGVSPPRLGCGVSPPRLGPATALP